MSVRHSRAGSAALLLAIAAAFAGCASVSSYQQARARYDRQDAQNREQIQQYNREINALISRGRAYQSALASERQLNRDNAALRQRIAELQSTTGNIPSSTPLPAPGSGLKDIGRAIDADSYRLLQKELRDYSALERLYDRQLKSLSSAPAGSPQYRKAAEIAQARALLDVIAEALLTAEIPGSLPPAAAAAAESRLVGAVEALSAVQERVVVALNDCKLAGRDGSDACSARAQGECRLLIDTVAAAASGARQSPSEQDSAARLEARRTITQLAAALLATADALGDTPPPPPDRLLVAQALKGREPIARTISAMLPARDSRGAGATRPMTDSELRTLDRMEWLMTMAAYCQGDTFKPETYLQLRLGEVRPLKAAVLEIVDAYERSHPDTTGSGKDAASPTSAKDPTAGGGQPYLNSFD